MVASRGTEQPRARQERVEELFKAHASTVYAYAVRRGARHADAEDIVAATFLVCFRRSREVPEDALPWLLGVARKVLAHHFRSERRRRALRRRMLHAAVTARRLYAGGAVEGPALTAYRRLRPAEKDVLRLVVLEGRTPEETGQLLGLSRKAVYSRLDRARAKLKGLLLDGRA